MFNRFLLFLVLTICFSKPILAQELNKELLSLSEQLLYAVKTEAPVHSILAEFGKLSSNDLVNGLPNDTARKVFWINVYNAQYQLLAEKPTAKPKKIFTEKSIYFKDLSFSLDDVEHCILRRYRWKLSLGYLSQFLPKPIIKQLAVKTIDYRIHFALNCGAKSCPPIAFYQYDRLDERLDLATKSFLTTETEVKDVSKTLRVTKIMQWFKADFGGTKGIRRIHTDYLEKDFSEYKVKFKPYDWSAALKNFKPQ
jgi:hypothetical protein